MSYQSINAALRADIKMREVTEFPDFETSHCPGIGSSMVYGLADLADSTMSQERIELRFFSRDKVLFRLDGAQRALTNLDKVLPEGRSRWLLDGYSVDGQNGLTLEFLPRYSCKLAEQAQAMYRQAMDFSGEQYSTAIAEYAAELRQRFLRRVFVSGNFQAWENLGVDAVAIVAGARRICVFEVEDEIKARKTVFDLTGERSPRFYIFE